MSNRRNGNGESRKQEDQSKRQKRALRILDAAAELIQRWGYNKTTIDDIARQARVAKGTIYLHWKAREDLFEALINREVLVVAEDIQRRIANDLEGATLHGLMKHSMLATMKNPTTFENGTLDLALSRPVSRTRYYLELWLCAIISGLILSILTIFAFWLSTLFVTNANVSWQWLFTAQAIEFAFLFMVTGLGMLFGSFINASRAAGGAAVGIIGLAYLMNTLGGLSDKLTWMQKIQPFYYTQAAQALALHTVSWWYPWVPVLIGLVLGIIGLVVFNRHDLPTT